MLLDDCLAERDVPRDVSTPRWKNLLLSRLDQNVLILALWSVPVSIALAETFLVLAILARTWRLIRRRAELFLPTCFWYWLLWAALEVVVCIFSPQPLLGWGEIRHLLLGGTLFLVLPTLNRSADVRIVWQGIFLTATLSSLFLIGDFASRASVYHREIAAGGNVGLYLRSGGLLNHWMVYGTVEIVVIAGLLAFFSVYPGQWRRWWPVVGVNVVAVVLSLTRMIWAAGGLLLAIDLAWRRSKWIWALPALPLILYALAPNAVRLRVKESSNLGYYTNLERLQMLRVGWRMVGEHPLTGVGPGRVDQLYTRYLSPRDPVPAWHGHLHNNLAQMAAEFGIPVTLAAVLFIIFAFRDLRNAWRAAGSKEEQFVVRSALYALVGFVFAGLFEYTYGHSLGLILIGFAVVAALSSVRMNRWPQP